MKITKSQLKEIIKREVKKHLKEQSFEDNAQSLLKSELDISPQQIKALVTAYKDSDENQEEFVELAKENEDVSDLSKKILKKAWSLFKKAKKEE